MVVIYRLSNEIDADYVGNMIYENSSLKRVSVDGSYVENDYFQDHLGNNRVVVKSGKLGYVRKGVVRRQRNRDRVLKTGIPIYFERQGTSENRAPFAVQIVFYIQNKQALNS